LLTDSFVKAHKKGAYFPAALVRKKKGGLRVTYELLYLVCGLPFVD
jgi:hypothetical protein